MANRAQAKGKRGEEDFAALLRKILGQTKQGKSSPLGVGCTDPAKLITADVHGKGADMLRISGLAIEVKRQETLCVSTWWRQACLQADEHGLVPVLAYRQNRSKWTICLPAYFLQVGLDGFLTISEEVFTAWLLEWVENASY